MSAYSDFPVVSLTVVKAGDAHASGVVQIKVSRLLAYEQQTGFTRLRLTEGAWLDVREGTDEIDRRARLAAAQAVSARQGFPAVSPRARQA
jgi:hypothetical protein